MTIQSNELSPRQTQSRVMKPSTLGNSDSFSKRKQLSARNSNKLDDCYYYNKSLPNIKPKLDRPFQKKGSFEPFVMSYVPDRRTIFTRSVLERSQDKIQQSYNNVTKIGGFLIPSDLSSIFQYVIEPSTFIFESIRNINANSTAFDPIPQIENLFPMNFYQIIRNFCSDNGQDIYFSKHNLLHDSALFNKAIRKHPQIYPNGYDDPCDKKNFQVKIPGRYLKIPGGLIKKSDDWSVDVFDNEIHVLIRFIADYYKFDIRQFMMNVAVYEIFKTKTFGEIKYLSLEKSKLDPEEYHELTKGNISELYDFGYPHIYLPPNFNQEFRLNNEETEFPSLEHKSDKEIEQNQNILEQLQESKLTPAVEKEIEKLIDEAPSVTQLVFELIKENEISHEILNQTEDIIDKVADKLMFTCDEIENTTLREDEKVKSLASSESLNEKQEPQSAPTPKVIETNNENIKSTADLDKTYVVPQTSRFYIHTIKPISNAWIEIQQPNPLPDVIIELQKTTDIQLSLGETTSLTVNVVEDKSAMSPVYTLGEATEVAEDKSKKSPAKKQSWILMQQKKYREELGKLPTHLVDCNCVIKNTNRLMECNDEHVQQHPSMKRLRKLRSHKKSLSSMGFKKQNPCIIELTKQCYEETQKLRESFKPIILSNRFKTDEIETDTIEFQGIFDTDKKIDQMGDKIVETIKQPLENISGCIKESVGILGEFSNKVTTTLQETSEKWNPESFIGTFLTKMKSIIPDTKSGIVEKLSKLINFFCQFINIFKTQETFSLITSCHFVVNKLLKYISYGVSKIERGPLIDAVIRLLRRFGVTRKARKSLFNIHRDSLKAYFDKHTVQHEYPHIDIPGDKYHTAVNLDCFDCYCRTFYGVEPDLEHGYTVATDQFSERFKIYCACGNGSIDMNFHLQADREPKDPLPANISFVKAVSSWIGDVFFQRYGVYARGSHFVVNTDNYLVRGRSVITFISDLFTRISEYIRFELCGEQDETMLNKMKSQFGDWYEKSNHVISILKHSAEDSIFSVEQLRFCAKNVNLDLNQCYLEGLEIRKEMIKCKDQSLSRFFEKVFKTIEELHGSYIGSAFVKTTRHEPFHLCLIGAPNIGKTYLLNQIYVDSQAMLGNTVTNISAHTYINNPATEFYDGYCGQPVFIFDDIFQFRSPEIVIGENCILNQLKGRHPYALNCAHLEKKEVCFFTSEFIFSTCNAVINDATVSMNVMLDPLSVIRRFDQLAYVVPKPEFLGPQVTVTGLQTWNDAAKKHPLFNTQREMMCNFYVKTLSSEVQKFEEYDDFIRFFTKEYDKHATIQRALDIKESQKSRFEADHTLETYKYLENQREAACDTSAIIEQKFKFRREMEQNKRKAPRRTNQITALVDTVGGFIQDTLDNRKKPKREENEMFQFQALDDEPEQAQEADIDQIDVRREQLFANMLSKVLPEVRNLPAPLELTFNLKTMNGEAVLTSIVETIIINGRGPMNPIDPFEDAYCESIVRMANHYRENPPESLDHIHRFTEEDDTLMIRNQIRATVVSSYGMLARNRNAFTRDIAEIEQLYQADPESMRTLKSQVKFLVVILSIPKYYNYLLMKLTSLNENVTCITLTRLMELIMEHCLPFRQLDALVMEKVYYQFIYFLMVNGRVSTEYMHKHKDNKNLHTRIDRIMQAQKVSRLLFTFVEQALVEDKTYRGLVFKDDIILSNMFFDYQDSTSNELLFAKYKIMHAFDSMIKDCQNRHVDFEQKFGMDPKNILFIALGLIGAIVTPLVAYKVGKKFLNRETHFFEAENGKTILKFSELDEKGKDKFSKIKNTDNKETPITESTELGASKYARHAIGKGKKYMSKFGYENDKTLAGHEKDYTFRPEFLKDQNAFDLNRSLKNAAVSFRNTKLGVRSIGYFIKDRILLLNKHTFGSFGDSFIISGGLKLKYLDSKEVGFVTNSKNSAYAEGNDFALINLAELKCVSEYADITKHFVKQNDMGLGVIDQVYFSPPNYKIDPETHVATHDPFDAFRNCIGTELEFFETTRTFQSANEQTSITMAKYFIYKTISTYGDCGTPLIINNTAFPRKILGIHFGGSSSNAYGAIITQEELQKYFQNFKVALQSFDDPQILPYDHTTNNAVIVREKDIIPDIEILGTLKKDEVVRMNTRTHIRPTPIQNLVYPTKVAPACMKVQNGIDPLLKGITNNFCGDVILNTEKLKNSVHRVATLLNNLVSPYQGYDKIDDEHNLNGEPSDPIFIPIDHDTSPGYPWCLYGKKEFGKERVISKTREGETQRNHFELLQHTKEQIEELESQIKEGFKPNFFIVDCKKDEKRTLDKVTTGNTRIFNCLPFPINHLVRRWCHLFNLHNQHNCVNGPVAIGINPHSEQWGMLYRRLLTAGNNFIAGDYSKWDKKLPYQVIMAGVEVINLCSPNNSPDTENIRMTLIESIVTAPHIAGSTVYRAHHGMPSGVVLTANLNSVCNAIVFDYVFRELATENQFSKELNFFDVCQATFYGDDHIVSVSDSCPWFNMKTFSQAVKKYVGLDYTTTTKGEVTITYERPNEVRFLKRRFVDEKGYIYAPLDFDVLQELWNWTTKGDIMQNTQENIRAYYQELSQHKYSFYKKQKEYLMRKCTRIGFKTTHPEFEDMRKLLHVGDVCFERFEFQSGSDDEKQNLLPQEKEFIKVSYFHNFCAQHDRTVKQKEELTLVGKCPRCNLLIWKKSVFKTDFHFESTEEAPEQFDKTVTTTEKGITGFSDLTDEDMHTFFRATKMPKETNPYPEPSIVQFIERPYVIANIQWSPVNEGIIFEASFPFVMFNQKPIWDKLKNFTLFRYQYIELAIRINGTQFHYGDLVATSVPMYENGISQKGKVGIYDSLNSLIPNGSIIGACNDTTTKIKIPYINFKQYIDLNKINAVIPYELVRQQMSYFRLFVLNPLQPSTANVTIIANFSGVEIGGYDTDRSDYIPKPFTVPQWTLKPNQLTYEVTAETYDIEKKEKLDKLDEYIRIQFQSLEDNDFHFESHEDDAHSDTTGSELDYPLEESDNEEEAPFYFQGSEERDKQDKNWISSVLSKVSMVGSFFGNFGKVFSGITGVASIIARAFGYAKPIDESLYTKVLQRNINTSNSRGIEYATPISVDPCNKVGLAHNLMGGDITDSSLIYNMERYGLLINRIQITSSSMPGDILRTFGCHPLIVPSTMVNSDKGEVVFHTPLSFFASLATYWRGSMIYKFHFCSSPFHIARFRLTWHPEVFYPLTPSERLVDETNAVSHIIDVNKTMDFEMTVPYLSDHIYMINSLIANERVGLSLNTLQMNGYITISVLQILNSNTEPITPIYLNVFVRAGPDMVLARPTLERVSNLPYTEAPPTETIEFQSLSDTPIETNKVVQPKNLCFGEDLTSVYDFLKRDNYAFPLTRNETVQIDPLNAFPATNYNFLPYISQFFRYWRGSRVFTLIIDSASTCTINHKISTKNPKSSRFVKIDPYKAITFQEGCQFFPYYLPAYNNPSAMIPYYYPEAFIPNVMYGSSTLNQERLLIEATSQHSDGFISEKVADDFQLACPIGAPTIMYDKFIKRI
uniref:Genome polyprotein n=1 Tax=Insectivora picornavirus TaxID=3039002 RepID=A0AAT9TYP8_9PICO|nr:MAG: polyprotein [Insectivora picornavirus]